MGVLLWGSPQWAHAHPPAYGCRHGWQSALPPPFHGVRRVALSADDAVVGVVIHAGLGGNRQPQRWGVHVHIVIFLRQLVGRRRGIRIILLIPLIGQLVAFQALCRDREGDPVMFAVQQVVSGSSS